MNNILGEVLLWDLSKEDDMLIGSSGMGSDSHREPVTKVITNSIYIISNIDEHIVYFTSWS